MERIEALVNFLGCKIEDLKEGYREEVFKTKDYKEYLVLTDDEADREFYEYEENNIKDLGLDLFTDWAKDYIIENCIDTDWFDMCMREDYESYCSDIETEKSRFSKYENRLQEEMEHANCKTKEDYVEYLCDGYNNSVEWFKESFGNEELKNVINNNNLLDTDKVVEYIKEEDGRGILAGWDGIENEEGEYFIYRLN